MSPKIKGSPVAALFLKEAKRKSAVKNNTVIALEIGESAILKNAYIKNTIMEVRSNGFKLISVKSVLIRKEINAAIKTVTHPHPQNFMR